jgi:hypothetical protein
MICGEPGPNLYWFGDCEDFHWATCLMQPLGRSNGYQVVLPCNKNETSLSIRLSSIEGGTILNKYDSKMNAILVELDCNIWRIVLKKFFLLSMTPGREYIDLENFNVYEEANFIIDSQF